VAEGAALDRAGSKLKEISLRASEQSSVHPSLLAASLSALMMLPSLPAVTVEMAQAAEGRELSPLRRQMRWTGKPAAVATAVAVAAEPAPGLLILRTPYKEVSGA
jgi:hypothetical protein